MEEAEINFLKNQRNERKMCSTDSMTGGGKKLWKEK